MLSVEQLSYDRYFQPVFKPVDFQLSGGDLLLVTGANGSGKTTLIRLLAGILTPTKGSIQHRGNGINYVGHQLAIKDDLSVTENIRFMHEFLGSPSCTVDAAVDRVGLRRVSGQLARTLSAGQRKRCALARLLLSKAKLWLLDEPYSNLDDEGTSLVDDLLQHHSKHGGSCVLATHGHHRPADTSLAEIRLTAGHESR